MKWIISQLMDAGLLLSRSVSQFTEILHQELDVLPGNESFGVADCFVERAS